MANCRDCCSTPVLGDAPILLDEPKLRPKAALGHCGEVRSKRPLQTIIHHLPTDCAAAFKGLSARTLRRLPALALALYTESDPCSMDEALDALSQAVDDESAVKTERETLI